MSYAYRVTPGEKFSLAEIPTDDKGNFSDKKDPRVAEETAHLLGRLSELQERLYAEQQRSLLVILQAMDAGGKDGMLRKVVGPLDSRGVQISNFKVPIGEETMHDYLWRAHQKCPRKGDIGFFNRSYYEDVLVVRVLNLAPKKRWEKRFAHINAFEQMLTDENTTVVKIFLHISKDEQKQRLTERLEDPDKQWKFDPKDLEMRQHWDDFQTAYEETFARTSTEAAPWFIVPADRKWFRDLAVAETLVHVLEQMDPQYPKPSYDAKKIHIT